MFEDFGFRISGCIHEPKYLLLGEDRSIESPTALQNPHEARRDFHICPQFKETTNSDSGYLFSRSIWILSYSKP